jgi:hypothetical protein
MQSYHNHDSHDGPNSLRETQMPVGTTAPQADIMAVHGRSSSVNARRSPNPHVIARRLIPRSSSSATLIDLPVPLRSEPKEHSSGTWTTSSGDPDAFEDADGMEDRGIFIEDYNRLARKVTWPRYGLRYDNSLITSHSTAFV